MRRVKKSGLSNHLEKVLRTSVWFLSIILEMLCSDHWKCDLQHKNSNGFRQSSGRFFPTSRKVGIKKLLERQDMLWCLQTWA
jgi:hypothetical protein